MKNYFKTVVLLSLLAVAGAAKAAGELRRLTDDGCRKFAPVYLPDGNSIAFSVHEVPNQVCVRKLNLSDGTQERLFPADPAHQFDVAFSPDGRYTCYCRSAGVRQLLLVIRDNQQQRKEITFLPPGSSRSTVRSLQFTPDSRRIVFTLSGDRGLQIASIDTEGQDLRYLTESVGTNAWPSISPDGQQIAFSSSRDGNYDIYLMDSDGGNVRQVTDSPTRDIRPAWSPDGRRIAFMSVRDGNPEIYVMDKDGHGVQRVTNDPNVDDFPIWQPDGRGLLIIAERGGRFDLYLLALPD